MATLGTVYAPPGVYTETKFENQVQAALQGVRIPVIVGTGNELLTQPDLQVIRGSSSSVDQFVPQEDMAGRAVVSQTLAGVVTLGDFDGVRRLVQVRNFPIVSGEGAGTPALDTSSITVTINGRPDVVLSLQAEKGIIELATAPVSTDVVRVSYFFSRKDTLILDDVSSQVTADPAVIRGLGEQPVGGYEVTVDNNTLILVVDGVSHTVSLGTPGLKPASTLVSIINGALAATSLTSSIYTTNFGGTAIQFSADQSLSIGLGTANTLLGLTAGSSTNRRTTFYTYQGPIVDGSNGGVTTTDPRRVTVRVNNVLVTPTAVNGTTRAVTLPFAPASGSTVTIEYYFNSWQDTFDYLANINVTSVTRCGIVPGNSDFVQGADFILKDDKIVWGTAVLTSPGVHTEGSTFFGGEEGGQVSALLVDNQTFLEAATPVTNTSVNPPVTSRVEFDLPLQPTTGNGRNTPLGQSLFQKVSNNRIDLPTNRPDLVVAYWGFSVEDALERGPVEVIKVEGTRITLRNPVDVGASVYATFYYNTLVDEEYSLVVDVPGPSGVGSYFVQDASGRSLFTPKFGVKGALLTGVTVVFPSGSELTPDVRIESGIPVEETVTVTFENLDDTLAKYSVPGASPYFTIQDASDHARFLIDNVALAGAGAGIDLSRVDGITGLGVSASLMGEEIAYTTDSGNTTYDIVAGENDEVSLTIDDVIFTAIAAPGTGVNASEYVEAINAYAKLPENAPFYTAQTRFLGSTVIAAGDYDTLRFNYTGSVSGASGPLSAVIAPATYASPTALATAVEAAIATQVGGLGAGFDGLDIAVSADANGRLRFTLVPAEDDVGTIAQGTITVTGVPVPVVGDTLTFTTHDGQTATLTAANVTTPGANNFDVSSGVAATIAAQLDIAINDATNDTAGIVSSSVLGTVVTFDSIQRGSLANRLVVQASGTAGAFTLVQAAGATDASGGYLEFVNAVAPASDFAVLAGISTDAAAGGNQTKLLNTDVARRFTVAGGSGARIYDRILLRNRIVPGSGSMAGASQLAQTELRVEGNSAITETGLIPNSIGLAALGAVVQPATMFAEVGFLDGQVAAGTYADVRDGQPLVTFYAAGGTTPQNNVFKLNVDGALINVEFTDATGAAIPAAGSADVPLGPVTSANTVLAQLRAAAVAAGLPAATFVQEGAGIRVNSATSRASSALVVGDGNANDRLGFQAGATAERTSVEAEQLASALMGHHSATISDKYLDYANPGATYFAGLALASVLRDPANAKYLYLQSQAATVGGLGFSSSIALLAPSAPNGSWLLPGTGIEAEAGDGASGDEGFSGFFVTSSDPVDGSGSSNTSILNSGIGQDGVIGQTYRDAKTGLTFTVLPREGGGVYPTGVGASFTFEIRKKVVTDSNLPVNTIPGLQLLVTNTTGVPVGDSALVETFERGGNEPAIGDNYFVTYTYTKESFEVGLFSRQATIERVFGETSPNVSPVSVASYLALINGAVLVGIKQVQKLPNSVQASVESYVEALSELEGVLPGGASLDTLTVLRADSQDLYIAIKNHVAVESSFLKRAERTAILGTASGTQPSQVGDLAQVMRSTRVRLLYPDIVRLTLTDSNNNDRQFLLDGTFLAAAMAGNRASPNVDVATPWTYARLFGFDGLARPLDAVEQNQVAVRGVSVLEDRGASIRVRHGLTTDMSNQLTKLPTIITIADEVQKQTRVTMDRYIGVKFLPSLINQIEGRMATMYKGLVRAEIIAKYAQIAARPVVGDPTALELESAYQPVFPLLYILARFNLRSSLT